MLAAAQPRNAWPIEFNYAEPATYLRHSVELLLRVTVSHMDQHQAPRAADSTLARFGMRPKTIEKRIEFRALNF